MAVRTFCIVQEFEFVKKRWRPKQAREVPGRDVAARCVERARSANRPALAFSRTGDPDTGDFDDAELIASFAVPPEFTGDHPDF